MPRPDDSEALDALVALAARLRDTAGAVASRADAAARGAGIGIPRDDRQRGSDTGDGPAGPGWDSADFGAVIDFARMLGESIPDDLRSRLAGSTRETLLSVRALIDWYLEREDGQGPGPGPGGGGQPTSD